MRGDKARKDGRVEGRGGVRGRGRLDRCLCLHGGMQIGDAKSELEFRLVGTDSEVAADHEIGHQVTFPSGCPRVGRIGGRDGRRIRRGTVNGVERVKGGGGAGGRRGAVDRSGFGPAVTEVEDEVPGLAWPLIVETDRAFQSELWIERRVGRAQARKRGNVEARAAGPEQGPLAPDGQPRRRARGSGLAIGAG